MATLSDALRKGWLEVVPVPDWDDRQPIHSLYATPEFLDKIEEDPRLHDEHLSEAELTLYEHLWNSMSDFRCEIRPNAGEIKKVMPVTDGVWKMHPNGLRVFGWAPSTHALALVDYELASDTHKIRGLVSARQKDVLNFIKSHQLEETVLKGEYLEIFPNK